MEMLLPYEPGSYLKLIKYSFVLYWASIKRVLWLSFLLSIIIFIPRLISIAIGQDLFFNVPSLSPYRLWLILVNLVALMFFIAIIWRMHCITRDIEEPLIEDVKVGIKKALYVFIATIIQCIIVFSLTAIIYGVQVLMLHYQLLFSTHILGAVLTFLVFFGEGILILYVSTLFIFLIPVIAIEDKGIIAAIERSIYLVWNHWWRVFTLQITPWFCYLIVLLVIRYLLDINVHIFFLVHGQNNIWITILQIILSIFLIPWVAALLIVQVRDLELRKHLTQKDKNAV